IDKSGAWLSYKGERIGQGRENAKTFLREHPELAQRIEADILQKHGIRPGSPAVPTTSRDAKDGKDPRDRKDVKAAPPAATDEDAGGDDADGSGKGKGAAKAAAARGARARA